MSFRDFLLRNKKNPLLLNLLSNNKGLFLFLLYYNLFSFILLHQYNLQIDYYIDLHRNHF